MARTPSKATELAKVFSLVAALVCVVNTLPGFFELQIVQTADGPRCQYTPFSTTRAYELGYTWWYVTIFTFLPFTFLLIFNSLLIHTLVRAARHRQLMLSDGSRTPRRRHSTLTEVSRPSGDTSDVPAATTGPCDVRVQFWNCLCCFHRARDAVLQERRRLCHRSFELKYAGVSSGHSRVKKEGVENGCVYSENKTCDEGKAPMSNENHAAETSQKRQILTPQNSNSSSDGGSFQDKRENQACVYYAGRRSGVGLLRASSDNKQAKSSSRQSSLVHRERGLMVDSNGGLNCAVHSTLALSRSLSSQRPSPTHSYACSSLSLCPRSPDAVRPTRRSHEQHKVTLMLTVIVIIFLLCQLPWTVLYLYRAYLSAHDVTAAGSDAMKIAGNVVNLLAQVNASGNFYLYSFFSKRFRRTLARLLLFWKKELSHNSLVHL